MRILRTIESFLPCITGPARQAWGISHRLEQQGIDSPVLTSTLDVGRDLPPQETIGNVQVTRLPYSLKLMRYALTPGMSSHMDDFDLIHSHNYRNYQTDRAFFLPATGNFRLS
ncbi:MAG: hypothetical protein G3M70_03375 [Candidatus Nitronauta litoralis]|uniref:Glycosyltransferase family 4 protein n=1 Tax=Candidatus Nitronauta litoralis TaxID=2705533 RepID=A0A7T0FZ58_9BACT|nr:MAG: hypothetical protein G3M70_03375 [Candidatus Nitronauta litoralis]